MKNKMLTSELLGKAKIPNQGYVNPDGSSIRIDKDYFGNTRKTKNPTPGPFENLKEGVQEIKVW
jgi:alpha-N-arabinofuranosidase